MARASISPSALTDLEEIHSYISDDDPSNADQFTDKILTRFRMLAENPQAGRVWSNPRTHLRIFPIKSYLIFYVETNFGVEIFRVLHCARDIDSILDSDYEN